MGWKGTGEAQRVLDVHTRYLGVRLTVSNDQQIVLGFAASGVAGSRGQGGTRSRKANERRLRFLRMLKLRTDHKELESAGVISRGLRSVSMHSQRCAC